MEPNNDQKSPSRAESAPAACSTTALEAAQELAAELERKVFALDAKRQEMERQVARDIQMHGWLNAQRHAALTLCEIIKSSNDLAHSQKGRERGPDSTQD